MSRLFVVGSGPSLNEINLGLVGNDVSFGANRINRIYARTHWRPTRIFWGDVFNVRTYQDIKEHLAQGYECFFNQHVANQLAGALRVRPDPRLDPDWIMTDFIDLPPQAHTYSLCSEHHKHNPPESWHCHEDSYCKYGGTLHVALAHGVEEGYNPIYLVGVDLGQVASGTMDSPNYFDSNYQVFPFSPEAAASANHMWTYMHGLARKYCDKRGVEIYNAGIGGDLEAYERVDFESLF